MDTFLFVTAGIVSLAGTIIAVSAKHIYHAALGLAIALAGTAGLFVPLNGELIAVVQILVYLGAVAIAIVFILMLSPPYYLRRPKRNPMKMGVAALTAALLATPLAITILRMPEPVSGVSPVANPIVAIGREMLSNFVFPFEVISLVLTIAIVGAIVLARDLPEDDMPGSQAKTNEKTESPLTHATHVSVEEAP